MIGRILRDIDLDIVREAVRGAASAPLTASGFQVHRLPEWAYRQFPEPGLAIASQQASGVRLEFDTTADAIELDVLLIRPLREGETRLSKPPIFSAVVDGNVTDQVTVLEGDVLWLDGESQGIVPGTSTRVGLALAKDSSSPNRVEIWLPQTAWVEVLGARATAELTPAASDRIGWVHHGSSISHCAGADGPLGTWPAVAARLLGLDLTNLGFNGNAMLDPFTARTISDLPADLITLKIGINLVNGDAMTRRTFIPALNGFLDTIRAGHPTTPIVVITPIACPIHEHHPGPTVPDPANPGMFRAQPRSDGGDRLTLAGVRSAITAVVTERRIDDDRIHLFDGLELLGPADTDRLHDRLHPDALGYQLMGERFAAWAGGESSPIAATLDSTFHSSLYRTSDHGVEQDDGSS